MPIDPITILMVAVLGLLIVFMFRNSRKRKKQQEDLQSQMQPGAEVMTNFGLYGTLKSIDDVAKTAELEISPGNVIKVHSQTLAKVVDPDEPRSVEEAQARAEADLADLEAAEEAAGDEPSYGERIDPEKPSDSKPKKADD